MKPPVWVLRETVLALHDLLLAEFGGAAGVRDEGMLDSALSRPTNQFAYAATTDFPSLAAAYAFGIIRNHPFIDGNKRTGFAVAVLFLELNGLKVSAAEADATVQTLALAAHELDESAYAGWLRANSAQLRPASKKRK